MSRQGRGNLRFKPPFNEPPETCEPRQPPLTLKSILVQRKKGRGKQSKKLSKKLTWRPESELEQIRHFEIIEGERCNVKPDVAVNSKESSRILHFKSNWEKSQIVAKPIESCSKPIEQDKLHEQDEQDKQDEQDEQDEEPYDSDIDADLDSFSEDFDSDEDNENDYEMQRLQNLAEMQNNEFFLKAKTRRIELNPPKTKAASLRPSKGQLIWKGLCCFHLYQKLAKIFLYFCPKIGNALICRNWESC